MVFLCFWVFLESIHRWMDFIMKQPGSCMFSWGQYMNKGFPSGSDSKESSWIAIQETQVQSVPGSPEEGMTTHSSILAWKIPWTGETGRLQSMGLQRARHNWATEHALTDVFAYFGVHGEIRVKLLDHRIHECYTLEETGGSPKWSRHLTPMAAV